MGGVDWPKLVEIKKEIQRLPRVPVLPMLPPANPWRHNTVVHIVVIAKHVQHHGCCFFAFLDFSNDLFHTVSLIPLKTTLS